MSPDGNNAKPDPRYKFKSLDIYSSDEWMANSTKKYRCVFDKAETTYISAAFSFYNKYFDEKDWEAKISIKAFKLDGNNRKELCNLESQKVISKDKNIVTVYEGWGNATAGSYWKKGDYVWEGYIDGEFVGDKKFHIEDIGLVTREENPYFEVVSVKFYPGSFERCDPDKRRYITTFNREVTQYVWVEFKFKNKTKSDYYYEFYVNFYDDAGQHKASINTVNYIKANQKGQVFEIIEGWGSNNPGGWKDDIYSVEIVFMDVLIAAARFEVGNKEIEGVPQGLNIEQISEPIINTSEKVDENQSLDDVVKSLESLIGLTEVKLKIKEHIKYLDFLKLRKEKGFKEEDKISLHSVFTGNPGTGKTTVVKLIGKIYNKMGLLTKGHVLEVDRAALVAQFIGQTAPKVKEVLDEARGGILFIDEAYALARQGDDEKDFGKEVIEILLKEMSDGPGDVAIMVAGYPVEMEHFLDSNPGLKSRFKYYFHFEDYLPEELLQIAEHTCIKRDVKLDLPAREFLMKLITEEYRNRDRTFGNGRFAVSLVDESKMHLGLRLMNTVDVDKLDKDTLCTILLSDVEQLATARMKKKLDLKVDNELLTEALNEINSLTGMDNIKTEVSELIKLVSYYRETGKDVLNKFSLHSVFTGNPGTGKTTVARIMGKIYKALGMLERGHVVECDRERLVAGYVGQTAVKTKEMLEKAKGGVLFIDEAYSLSEGSENDFGKEAVETILKFMEDMRGQISVIVAGYPDNMQHFLESNPGLKSRFDKFFHFQDFSVEDLFNIAMSLLKKENITADENAKEHLKEYFTSLYANRDKYFGNARAIRGVINEAVKNQQLRMAGIDKDRRTKEMMEALILDDVSEFVVKTEENGHRPIGFRTAE